MEISRREQCARSLEIHTQCTPWQASQPQSSAAQMSGGCGAWKNRHTINATSLAEKRWTPSQMSSKRQPGIEMPPAVFAVKGPWETSVHIASVGVKEKGNLWWCNKCRLTSRRLSKFPWRQHCKQHGVAPCRGAVSCMLCYTLCCVLGVLWDVSLYGCEKKQSMKQPPVRTNGLCQMVSGSCKRSLRYWCSMSYTQNHSHSMGCEKIQLVQKMERVLRARPARVRPVLLGAVILLSGLPGSGASVTTPPPGQDLAEPVVLSECDFATREYSGGCWSAG